MMVVWAEKVIGTAATTAARAVASAAAARAVTPAAAWAVTSAGATAISRAWILFMLVAVRAMVPEWTPTAAKT